MRPANGQSRSRTHWQRESPPWCGANSKPGLPALTRHERAPDNAPTPSALRLPDALCPPYPACRLACRQPRLRERRRSGPCGQPDHRPVRRYHVSRPALSQRHAERQRGGAHVRRAHRQGREDAFPAGPRAELEARQRDHVGGQAAPRREIPRRQRVHLGRRGLLAGPAGAGQEQPLAVHHLHQGLQGSHRGRQADPAHHHQRPVPAGTQ
jgi:hypothetical protein